MTDQWYYRMFGEQFGPVPMEKLKELADCGTIQALDQVRAEASGDWVAAATIDELGLSTSTRNATTLVEPTIDDFDFSTPQAASIDDFDFSTLQPVKIDEFCLSLDDFQIASSTGPVPARVAAATRVSAAAPDPEATFRVAYEQAKVRLTESMLAQADAAFKVAEDQAKSQVAWATAPNIDRFWWGWAGGVEFGPVEFTQVFGLAKSGQLKPSDFVRNGSHGQFVPSSGVPGLFNAVQMIARATEARDLAKAQAQAAASLALPPPVVPTELIKAAEKAAATEQVSQHARSNPSISTPAATPRSSPRRETVRQPPKPSSHPQLSTRELDPEPAPELQPSRSEPNRSAYNSAASMGASTMAQGFSSSSSSSMSTYGASRPAAIPSKPPTRKPPASGSTWFSDTLDSLKQTKAIGSVCTIALVLLVLGWNFLPKSRAADIKKYQALKQLLDDVKSKRTSAPAELTAVQQKLEKVSKEISLELKSKASREEPAKQCLLWAARDEVPRFIQAGLAMESQAEKNLTARLQDAAYELGLERRPPVTPPRLATPGDDS